MATTKQKPKSPSTAQSVRKRDHLGEGSANGYLVKFKLSEDFEKAFPAPPQLPRPVTQLTEIDEDAPPHVLGYDPRVIAALTDAWSEAIKPPAVPEPVAPPPTVTDSKRRRRDAPEQPPVAAPPAVEKKVPDLRIPLSTLKARAPPPRTLVLSSRNVDVGSMQRARLASLEHLRETALTSRKRTLAPSVSVHPSGAMTARSTIVIPVAPLNSTFEATHEQRRMKARLSHLQAEEDRFQAMKDTVTAYDRRIKQIEYRKKERLQKQQALEREEGAFREARSRLLRRFKRDPEFTADMLEISLAVLAARSAATLAAVTGVNEESLDGVPPEELYAKLPTLEDLEARAAELEAAAALAAAGAPSSTDPVAPGDPKRPGDSKVLDKSASSVTRPTSSPAETPAGRGLRKETSGQRLPGIALEPPTPVDGRHLKKEISGGKLPGLGNLDTQKTLAEGALGSASSTNDKRSRS